MFSELSCAWNEQLVAQDEAAAKAVNALEVAVPVAAS